MAAGSSALLSLPCPADPMASRKGVPSSPSAESRQWLREPEHSQGCKPVLLEKTNCLSSEAATGRSDRPVACPELAVSTVLGKPRLGRLLPPKASAQHRQSAFTELPRLWERLGEDPTTQPGPQRLAPDVPRAPAGSTVCLVWPCAARGEQKSAFSKPAKRWAERPGRLPVFPAGEHADALGELSGLLSAVDIPCWGRLSTSKLMGDFWNLQTLSQNALLCTAFQGAPRPWLELGQLQAPTASAPSATAPASLAAPSAPSATASRALLPPTLSSLGLSTQNWCAKCSLAFRLTADLVFHMRSHHKRERAAPDLSPKKRREEALTCPICHEYFRERHHLSRHMTSHT